MDYFFPQRDDPRATSTLKDDKSQLPSVLYQLGDFDEQFIRDGAKLINVKLSELDSCHHRVLLTLKKKCDSLSAEEIGKLSVMFMNCQSNVEGRQIYSCTHSMVLYIFFLFVGKKYKLHIIFRH